jgi:hypothetical protein
MEPAGSDHCGRFTENSGDLAVILRANLIEAVEGNVLVHERAEIARAEYAPI